MALAAGIRHLPHMLPCLCCALLLPAGIPYMQLEELAQGTSPAGDGADAAGASGSGSKRVPAGQLDAAERLVRDLALLLTSSSGDVAAAVQRLQYVAHDLPRVLSGPLLELLAAVTSEALTDADSLRKRQQQLATFLAVVAAELPQQLTTGSAAADASADSSSWLSAGQAGSQPAAEGLLELLGEQDSGEVLRHAAERQAGARSARMADNTQDGDDEGHLYGWLANIHHDQDMQRYLQVRRGVNHTVHVGRLRAGRHAATCRLSWVVQAAFPRRGTSCIQLWGVAAVCVTNKTHLAAISRLRAGPMSPAHEPWCCACLAASQIEFDPSLAVDVAHTPRGWRDSDLFTSSPDFLEGMRPLLDTYLAAQGEAPLQDMEWQVRARARQTRVNWREVCCHLGFALLYCKHCWGCSCRHHGTMGGMDANSLASMRAASPCDVAAAQRKCKAVLCVLPPPQVYRDAALAEADQVEAEAAAARAAAGHSPFNNSRADEAYLRERLEAGIPPGSVLYAAAHKYLTASFHNRTWRFAQRKRMVDVLIAIADHLAAHPPRSHRGSPFSALFQPDGPPLVPRISQQPSLKEAGTEAYALPAGFGAASTLPPQ